MTNHVLAFCDVIRSAFNLFQILLKKCLAAVIILQNKTVDACIAFYLPHWASFWMYQKDKIKKTPLQNFCTLIDRNKLLFKLNDKQPGIKFVF